MHDTSPEFSSDGSTPALPEGLYRHLFESSFGLTVVMDGAGSIRAMSDAAAHVLGADSVGTPLAEGRWWADADRVAVAIESAQEGQFERFYAPAHGPSGHLTFLVDLQAIEGPEGEPWLLLEARDVTTLVAVEHQLQDVLGQLRRERDRLRAVLDATPDRVIGVDASGRATVVNPAFAEADGRAPEDIEGTPYLGDAEHPELWRRALAGETVRTRVPPQDTPFGTWLDLTVAPILADHLVEGAVAIARDATAQVEADQLRRAIGAGRVAMLSASEGGAVDAPSEVLCEIFRTASAADLVDLMAAVQPDDAERARAVLREAFARPGTAVDLRLRLRVERAALWLRGRSLPGRNGGRFIGVAYEADEHVDPAAAARWADLHQQSGWAGRRDGDRVALQESPAPDEALVSQRLAALHETGLLDTAPSEALDLVTRAATEALGVPVSLVSLVDSERQFFKSIAGLSGEAAEARETPLSHSFCQHVANERRPLVVRDARETKRLASNKAIDDLGVVAYLGVPIAAPDGHVIGALCAIDSKPHVWTEDDVRLMSSLAEAVTAEVAQHHPNPTR